MIDDPVSRLPADWQTLFKWLAKDDDHADIIYNNMMYSKYGSQPDWNHLLKSLLMEDPVIEGEKLIFKPRLLLLSDQLQKQFISFLERHSARIPDACIKHFVWTLSPHVKPSSAIYEDFMKCSANMKVDFPIELKPEIVCKKEQNTNSDIDTEQSKQGGIAASDAVKSCDERAMANGDDGEFIVIDDDDDNDNDNDDEHKHPTKRARSDSNEVEQSHKRARLGSGDIEESHELAAKSKVDIENVSFVQSNKEKTEDTGHSADVTEQVQIVGAKLKDIWINGSVEVPYSELRELSTLTMDEIDTVCHMVEFSILTEDSLCSVCEHVMSVWDSFSYAAGVCLLKNMLSDRINNLTEKISRHLSHTITVVASKCHKQFIDGVMIPGFKVTSEFSSFKSDIFVSVIKESLTSGTRLYLLEHILSFSSTLTENLVVIIHCIVESSCDFNENVFKNLLEKLLETGSEFSKNIKYGKFLLSLTNKHGKDLKSIDLLGKVIGFHNTFFKKTILTALKKIKS